MKIFVAILSGILLGWLGATTTSNVAVDQRKDVSHDNRDAKPVHISIITDIDRCMTRAFATRANLDRFVRFANMQKNHFDGTILNNGPSDLAFSLGDNIAHRLENCSTSATKDLNFVADAMKGLSMPMHYVLGDHDIDSDAETLSTWRRHTGRDETFYSFDHEDIHIIVLDTILGGQSILPCEKDPQCTQLLTEKANLKAILASDSKRKKSDTTKETVRKEKLGKKEILAHRARITSLELMIESHKKSATHLLSTDVRDHGMIGKSQLLWLAHDLATTPYEKILIFADHPLFPFTTTKKSYQIDDLEALTTILHDARDNGKEINTISGEAHTWSRKEIDGITYHVIDEFRSEEGTWAHAVWDNELTIYKVINDKIKTNLK